MIRNKTNHINTQWIYELALQNNQQNRQTLRPIKQKKEKNKEETREGKGRREERARLTESEINRNT